MDNRSVNGSNDTLQENLEEYFNNAFVDYMWNRAIEEREESMEVLAADSRDENEQLELDQQQLQLDHVNPQGEESDHDEVHSSLSVVDSSDSRSSSNVRHQLKIHRASDLFMAVSITENSIKNKIIQQAANAMEELTNISTKGEPLWLRIGYGDTEILNGFQYLRELGHYDSTIEKIIKMVQMNEPQQYFPSSMNLPFEVLNIEASRWIDFVDLRPVEIVELLMDTNQWMATFYNVVSGATLLGVLLEGDGSYNGMLQVLTADLYQASPLIPARQTYFARYCRKLGNGKWGVVDVSLENLFPFPQILYRRRPSGCIIEEMPNGSSTKITWMEHVEVDYKSLHPMFHPIVSSGFAFSAKRWVSMIHKQCQWLQTMSATSISSQSDVFIQQGGRDSLLKLSDMVTRNFFKNISSSADDVWMELPLAVSADRNIRFKFGSSLSVPGRPVSTTFVYTTSIQIPVPPKIVFDFLRHGSSREKWDILSYNKFIREIAFVINGDNPENRVSVLQVNSSLNQIEILYVQESFSDKTGAYVVHASLDILTMSMVLNGGNPNFTSLLSSGFVILPDKPPGQGLEPVGTILTIAFQSADLFATGDYIPTESLKAIDGILTTTANRIKDAVWPFDSN